LGYLARDREKGGGVMGRDDPDELHTVADDEQPLSREEAAVAGMLPGQAVYGDSSYEPNEDDHRDAEGGVDQDTP
jgi:hypothetical protein